MNRFIVLVLIGIVSVVLSCEDERCDESIENRLRIEFAVDDAFPSNLIPDSIALFSPGWNDSIYYTQEGSNNIISFPLSPVDEMTTIILSNDSLNDTLTAYYTTSVHLISEACGFINTFTVDSLNISAQLVDSLTLHSKEISNTDEVHITLYY